MQVVVINLKYVPNGNGEVEVKYPHLNGIQASAPSSMSIIPTSTRSSDIENSVHQTTTTAITITTTIMATTNAAPIVTEAVPQQCQQEHPVALPTALPNSESSSSSPPDFDSPLGAHRLVTEKLSQRERSHVIVSYSFSVDPLNIFFFRAF